MSETKKSIADCLQTRPIDYRARLVAVRGNLEHKTMKKINKALKFLRFDYFFLVPTRLCSHPVPFISIWYLESKIYFGRPR
jgi:starvation-inducible outer membrane lipoprotein